MGITGAVFGGRAGTIEEAKEGSRIEEYCLSAGGCCLRDLLGMFLGIGIWDFGIWNWDLELGVEIWDLGIGNSELEMQK